MLSQIADKFEVTVDYLIGREDKKSSGSELDDFIAQLKTRPELKKLLSVTKDASKEEIEKAADIIEAWLK